MKVKDVYIRYLVGVILIITSITILHHLALKVFGSDEDGDLHGVPAILMGFVYGAIPTSFLYLVLTGRLKKVIEDEVKVESSTSVSSVVSNYEVYELKINTALILFLLSVSWLLSFLYCELLWTSIKDALVDPTTLGLQLPPQAAAKIQIMMKGIILFGCFCPIVAGSCFLAGWLMVHRLSFYHMIFPSSIFYISINLIAVYQGGQPTIVLAIRQFLTDYGFVSTNTNLNLGQEAVIWFLAIALMLLMTFIITSCSWFFVRVGSFLRKKMIRSRQKGVQQPSFS